MYDAAGRVTSTVDARGIKLQYGYDALDRRTAVFQTGVGTRARWYYDTLAKGQLDKSIRFGTNSANYTRQINAYDDAYRPTMQTYTIPSIETGLAGSYTVESYYKIDGSLSATGYPAAGDLPAETVYYQYNETTGLPVTSTGGTGSRAVSYAAGTDYDALGRISQLTLYPGLFDDIGKRVYQTFGYELETGRLVNTRTDRESVTPYAVTNTSYTYDNAGNITKTADTATGDNQCFQYDYLRRLTQAWTPATDDCTTTPSTSALGGPAPYWQSWTYDLTGNRLTQTDHTTTTGGTDTTTGYTYPTPGAAHPHALTSTTATTGGYSVTSGYTYDNSGNTLARTNTAGNTQTLTWDPEGHLATSTDTTGTTSYLYDADGNRLISHDPAGATLFLPGQDVRYTTTTATSTCTRYYTFAGSTIASRTATGVTWLSSDHQGTATTAVDQDTLNATIRRQNPFGAPRGTPAAWPNTRGFVGGTTDNTGLTHLGAREYDPGIGRFISVDPVQDLTDPQQWNGYTYAGSNPVTMSDPTGLVPIDPDLDDQFGRELPGTGKYDHRTPGMGGGGDNRPHPNPTPSANPGSGGGGSPTPSATPTPSPYFGESMEYQQDWNRRYNEMCAQALLTEICSDAMKRRVAEPMSWIPYVGIPAQAWLVKDDYDNGHPVAAGIGAAGLLPLGKIFSKAAEGLELTKAEQRAVNEFVGNAYRDHVADFLRQNGRIVVTDAQDRAALTFKIPGKTDRILDMKVMDKHGNLLGYVETKSGNAGQDAGQAAKDAYLQGEGVSITYVYDDMANMLY